MLHTHSATGQPPPSYQFCDLTLCSTSVVVCLVIYKVVCAKYSQSRKQLGVAAERRGCYIRNTDNLALVPNDEVTKITMIWNTVITVVGHKESISMVSVIFPESH